MILPTALHDKEHSKVYRNLLRDILLFETAVSGTYKIKDKTSLTKLKGNEELPYARSESKYEPDAIVIETVDGIKVG